MKSAVGQRVCEIEISEGMMLGVKWEAIGSGETRVLFVKEGSIGEKAGIECGSKLVSIDGNESIDCDQIEDALARMKKRGRGRIILELGSKPIPLPPATPLFGMFRSQCYGETDDCNEHGLSSSFCFPGFSSSVGSESEVLEWKDTSTTRTASPTSSPNSSIASSTNSPETFLKRSAFKSKKKPRLPSLLEAAEDNFGNSSFNNGSFSDPVGHKIRKTKSCELFLSALDDEEESGPATSCPTLSSIAYTRVTSILKTASGRLTRSQSDAVKHTTWAPEVTTPIKGSGPSFRSNTQ
eukprot:TRINITY_DN326_c7_g2_i2.p1 TRINITY_DN326_c7_g2~~TRINITY_DN326_c7_g2_i2.p1  ORF type:complete len:295 (+),score=61.54 TRINITY_DN326_c7_g2_i2:74-958(+)